MWKTVITRTAPSVSIGKSNSLFHRLRLRAPALLPILYHRVPPPGAPALSGSAAVPVARRPLNGGVALLLRRRAREKAPCLFPFHPKAGRGRVVVKHTRASCELPLLDKVLWRALDDDPQCPQCRTTRQAHERIGGGAVSVCTGVPLHRGYMAACEGSQNA